MPLFFYPGYGIGMDGAGFWRAYVSSADVFVTAYAGDRLGDLF